MVKGLMSKDGAINVVTLNFIVSLKMPCLQSRSLAFNNSMAFYLGHPPIGFFP
jgi:hypothetical protein